MVQIPSRTSVLANQVETCQRALGDYDAILRFDRLRVDLNRAASFLRDFHEAEAPGFSEPAIRFLNEANVALDRAMHEADLADGSLAPFYDIFDTPEVNEARAGVHRIRDALRDLPLPSVETPAAASRVGELTSAAGRVEDLVKSLTSRAIATCLARSMEAP
ncbi:MAG: hypothetical protein KGJ23_08385 [Euryarchaeota archaeon]|nr:hypothetical protein [Euryarchaeota archaeon]MDE1836620.1 hypothetical protein [Euryarchaeota archaeon]MDE1879185.1 hypothetical protein [Euryarchaeota archaeon]MDE2044590.1 hypothetical protein [Thermoplasmata archaeon]